VLGVAESRSAQPNQHSAQIEFAHLLVDFIHRGGGGAGVGCGDDLSSLMLGGV